MVKKRLRDVEIVFYIDEEERKVLEKNMKSSGIKNRSNYIRKMIFNGQIIKVDLREIKELSRQINVEGNKVNKIAKAVNEFGELNEFQFNELIKYLREIIECYKKHISNSLCENKKPNRIRINFHD